MDKKDFDIRSEEVQDILSFVPSWMIRWGSVLFAVIFLLLLLFTWFIKYPDTITGDVILTTTNPPIRLVNRLDGKIKLLHFQEGDEVNKGDKIIDIESVLESNDVKFLLEFLQAVKANLVDENKNFNFQNNDNSLGEIQKDYNQLLTNLHQLNDIRKNKYYQKEKLTLAKKIQNYGQLFKSNKNKLSISAESYEIAQEKFQINQELYALKTMSKMNYLDAREVFNGIKKEFESNNTLLIDSRITLDGLQGSYDKLLFDRQEQKRVLSENIQNGIRDIENYIERWNQNNILRAPLSGTLYFSKPLYPNMFVKSNESLFTITPKGGDYIGYINIKQQAIGKMKVGDKVFMKFDNYPYREFGQIKGEVSYIPSISSNNQLIVSIKLTNGLVTTYNKRVVLFPEMKGEAEVITKDIRLAERFVYHIYSLIDD